MSIIAEVWHSLTREQQRMVAMVSGGIVLILLVYILTSGLLALAVAAVYAYSVGRYRSTHRPERPDGAPEPPADPAGRSESPQRHSSQARVRPRPQTPLGRLFAERPAWSGPPVGPFEPPRRTPPPILDEEERTVRLDDRERR